MIRSIVEDYDARLTPAAGSTGADLRGKSQWKRYGDGETKFTVNVHGAPIANGVTVDVRLGRDSVGSMIVNNGRCRLVRDSRAGEDVPTVRAGTRIEVWRGAALVAEGTFEPD